MSSATATVSENLLERIEAHEWEHGQALPSRNQLSEQYGVSPATVSNVIKNLSKQNRVRSEPGRGVFVVSPDHDEAGCAVDSEKADAKAGQVIALVGSYIPPKEEFDQQGMAVATRDSVMDGIWSAAQNSGDHLLLLSQQREDFDIDMVAKQNFDGMILLGGLPLETLIKVRQSGIPAIHANASILGGPVNFIDYDNAAMIRQMVKIFSQNGHTKIASIMHETSVPEFLPWLCGNFHTALKEYGLNSSDCQWIETSDHAIQDPSEASAAISALLESDNPPTALYCHGPVTAGAAKKVLQEKGMSAPDDISVIASYNYSHQVDFSGFTIPNFELARQLIENLSLLIENPDYFVQKLLAVPFADNGSVGQVLTCQTGRAGVSGAGAKARHPSAARHSREGGNLCSLTPLNER